MSKKRKPRRRSPNRPSPNPNELFGAPPPPGKSKDDNDAFLDGEGGLPPMPDLPATSPYTMERLNRAITLYMEHVEPEGLEEANRVLGEFFMGRPLDEVVEDLKREGIWNTGEDAQELAFQAMEADDPDEAARLAREALELDPHNLDASRVLLVKEQEQEEEQGVFDIDTKAARYRELIAKAEERFGEAFMTENRGHFWGNVVTRPYIRLRSSLVLLLYMECRWEEAIAEGEAVLELNPEDNQQIRDPLLVSYLMVGDCKSARSLLKRYRDPSSALQAWASVLERFFSNNKSGARQALKRAMRVNPQVLFLYLGLQDWPELFPSYVSPGSQEEAVYAAALLGPVWSRHEAAIPWVISVVDDMLPE